MRVVRDIATGKLVSWWNPHSNSVGEDELEPFTGPQLAEGQELVELADEEAQAFTEELASTAGVSPDEGVGAVYLQPDSSTSTVKGQFPGRRKIGGYSLTVDPPGKRIADVNTQATLELLMDELKGQGATANTPLRLADLEKIVNKGKNRQ